MITISSNISSCYQTIAAIHPRHDVYLVQHAQTKKIYVKKLLSIYNLSVYQHLQENPVFGIPKIHEIIKNGNQLILIEEYISGDTLQEILEQEGVLSEEQIIPWILQLCDILLALHSFTPPIIHRDIKPSNLILSPSGKIFLLDLNAAKFASDSKSEDTILLGTRGYAAPEQYGLASSNIRTDIYAVGMLMNVLASGNLSSECCVKGCLTPIIKKCINWNPDERYPSILQLKNSLTALTTSLPAQPSLRPPGFRTGNPLHMLIAFMGYLMIFYFGLTLEIKNSASWKLIFERICLTISLLAIVFFSSNYQNLQQFFPLNHIKNPLFRILWIAFWDVAIFLLLLFILVLLELIPSGMAILILT